MTTPNLYTQAPATFGLCFQTGCATAGQCLRALAARDLTRERKYINAVNPLLVNTKGGADCPFFRKAEQVRVAFGFRNALKQVRHGEIRTVRGGIMGLVSRRGYYYLFNGERPIYPDMQRKIAGILARCGAEQPIEFDRYEYRYLWESTHE